MRRWWRWCRFMAWRCNMCLPHDSCEEVMELRREYPAIARRLKPCLKGEALHGTGWRKERARRLLGI